MFGYGYLSGFINPKFQIPMPLHLKCIKWIQPQQNVIFSCTSEVCLLFTIWAHCMKNSNIKFLPFYLFVELSWVFILSCNAIVRLHPYQYWKQNVAAITTIHTMVIGTRKILGMPVNHFFEHASIDVIDSIQKI